MAELEEVRRLRLKLKAAKALIRELGIAVAQAEEALEIAAHPNAQPEEAQRDHDREPVAA
jgi:hypothetical protein